MPKRIQPAKKDRNSAPDPARTYERARPEAEAGMGRLDTDPRLPHTRRDQIESAATNRQGPRQLNADDIVNQTGGVLPEDCQPTSPSRPRTRRDAAAQRRKDHASRRAHRP